MKKNNPHSAESWLKIGLDLLESGALRCLSVNGRRAHDRILIEHSHQGGQENGRRGETSKKSELAESSLKMRSTS
jgi:hypothetical protein